MNDASTSRASGVADDALPAAFREILERVRVIDSSLRGVQAEVAEQSRVVQQFSVENAKLREDLPEDTTDWLRAIEDALKGQRDVLESDRRLLGTLREQLDQQAMGGGIIGRLDAAVATAERRLVGSIAVREEQSKQRLKDADEQLARVDERLANAREVEKRIRNLRGLYWGERGGIAAGGMLLAGLIVWAMAAYWPVWSGSQALRLDPAALRWLLECQAIARNEPGKSIVCGDVKVSPFSVRPIN